MVGVLHVLKILKLILPFLWSLVRSQGVVSVIRQYWFPIGCLCLVVILSFACIYFVKDGMTVCPPPVLKCDGLAPSELDTLNQLLQGD